MNRIKFFVLISCAVLISGVVNFYEPVFATNTSDVLSSVGFGKIFAADPDKEIRKIFKLSDKYADSYDVKKMKTLFDKSFVNNDGFDYEKFFNMFESAKNSYKEGIHETTVNSVTVNGNYATAFVSEKFNATALETFLEQTEGDCKFSSYADIYYHLTKIDNKWKITAADTVSEYGILSCGAAQNIDMFIAAPNAVAANTKYTATLSVKAPQKVLTVASIQNDEMTFPLKESAPVFRPVDENGKLERVVTSCSSGKNELITSTLAFTSPVRENDKIVFRLNGSAVLMRRVNVFAKGNFGENLSD